MELNWRTQRQIIIFFTYFLIIFIPIAFFSYLMLRTQPSCYDKIMNGNEEGVDCNGSCLLRCEGTFRDLKVDFYRAFKVREGKYNFFVLLSNYNQSVYFPKVDYKLDSYSVEGELLSKASGTISVLPNSKAVILFSNADTDSILKEPKTIDFSMGEYKALEYPDADSIPRNISVENWQAQRGANNSLQVVGELKNPNNFEVKNISVYALLYDDTKTVYAVSKTKVYSIIGRDKVGVAFTWGDIITPKNVEFVVVLD